MNKEIYNNNKIQLLYDDETEELSFGFFPEQFTMYEHFVLARAFDMEDE